MLGVHVVGRHVLHQGLGSTTVEEVDGDSLVAAVAGSQLTIEVRQEVNVGAFVFAGSQDTGDLDTDIGHGV